MMVILGSGGTSKNLMMVLLDQIVAAEAKLTATPDAMFAFDRHALKGIISYFRRTAFLEDEVKRLEDQNYWLKVWLNFSVTLIIALLVVFAVFLSKGVTA